MCIYGTTKLYNNIFLVSMQKDFQKIGYFFKIKATRKGWFWLMNTLNLYSYNHKLIYRAPALVFEYY